MGVCRGSPELHQKTSVTWTPEIRSFYVSDISDIYGHKYSFDDFISIFSLSPHYDLIFYLVGRLSQNMAGLMLHFQLFLSASPFRILILGLAYPLVICYVAIEHGH